MSGDQQVDGARAEVALEVSPRRVFAIAVAWPGWTRSGRDEAAALEALVGAGPRYGAVAAAAGVPFRAPADRADLEVAVRVDGNATTAFGAPAMPLPGDDTPLDPADLERLAAILEAAWAAFDSAAARHATDRLATGPRGGGRSVEKIVEHVLGADEGYLVQLGARPPKVPAGAATPGEPRTAELRAGELRGAALVALRARALGLPVEHPSRATKPWAPRFYLRRAAWHALDHAWEIEDRAAAAEA